MILTQSEADALLAMRKLPASQQEVQFPDLGKKARVDLLSRDGREAFQLDIGRSYVKLTRATFQTRARSTVVLARLDLDGAPHTNPDGGELPCPHLHVYCERFRDKWAYPVSPEQFGNPSDRKAALYDFMAYCAIDPIAFRFDLLS